MQPLEPTQASRWSLLTGPSHRSKQINHDYELARREFEDSKKILDAHTQEHGCQVALKPSHHRIVK